MKTNIFSMSAIFMVLVILPVLALAGEPGQLLSGTYKLLSDDCLAPVSAPITPRQLIVEADARHVVLEQPENIGGTVLNAIVDTMNVGDATFDVWGGGQFRQVGLFSNSGTTFTYQEYDNQTSGGVMDLLRTKTLELRGESLTITYAEAGYAPKRCVLIRQ